MEPGRHTQRLTRSPVAVVALALVMVGVVTAVVLDPPETTDEWVAIALGGVLVVMLWFVKLEIVVGETAIDVRLFGPFRRRIPLRDISQVEVADYRPLRQFGGWGWRLGRGGARQYALAGSRAVKLTLNHGKEIYLGSDELDVLHAEIENARAARA
jgi:hypothetical protein